MDIILNENITYNTEHSKHSDSKSVQYNFRNLQIA